MVLGLKALLCRSIMKAAETILFVVTQPFTAQESQTYNQASTSASHSGSADLPLFVNILKKVASDVANVISGKRILKEEKINVEDCVLDL